MPDLDGWRALVARIKAPKPTLEIALVGKYIELPDAYLSVTESLKHAAWASGVDAKVRWVDSEQLTAENVGERLAGAAGVLVPGGFGHRGIEGKVLAAHWAREHGIPYLGLCLGLQCAVIEFAREVIGTADVNSTEFDMFTTNPVIDFMPDQRDLEDKGGTMRLGLYPAKLLAGSKARAVYGQEVVYERHRHRFEVNNRYRQTLEAAGMLLSGISPDSRLVEIVELKDHPWFVASQFHPEFKSRPERPHPLFSGFVTAAIAVGEGREPVFRAPEPEAVPDAASTLIAGRGRTRRRPRRGPMSSDPSAAPELALRPSLLGRAVGGLGTSIVAGVLLGGSAWFSDQLSWPYSLLVPTNAIGVWVGVAFALGASARTLPTGALRGLIGLLAAVGAYYLLFATLGAGYRAIGAGHAATVWGLVALVAGPVMGGAGATWRHGHGWPRAFAVAVLSAALLAEGVMFGLGRLVHVDQLLDRPRRPAVRHRDPLGPPCRRCSCPRASACAGISRRSRSAWRRDRDRSGHAALRGIADRF